MGLWEKLYRPMPKANEPAPQVFQKRQHKRAKLSAKDLAREASETLKHEPRS